jgi:hypothetical protein
MWYRRRYFAFNVSAEMLTAEVLEVVRTRTLAVLDTMIRRRSIHLAFGALWDCGKWTRYSRRAVRYISVLAIRGPVGKY